MQNNHITTEYCKTIDHRRGEKRKETKKGEKKGEKKVSAREINNDGKEEEDIFRKGR